MIFLIFFILSIILALFFKYKVKGYSALSVYLTAIAIILFCYFILGTFQVVFEESVLLNIIKGFLDCFVILLCVMFIIAQIPVIVYSKKRIKANSKYAIVLGAGVDNGKPSRVLSQRISATKEFMALYPETIIILSGGKVEDENLSEAECMKNELIKSGVDQKRLIIEDKSTTTVENFKFAKEILNKLSPAETAVTIISSDTHLYRACLLAKKSGLQPSPFYAKNIYPILKLSTALKEAVALWEQWLFKNKKHGK